MPADKPKEVEPSFESMTTEEQIKHLYENGDGKGHAPSIQDIARKYRYSVEEVLQILGQTDLLTIQTQGDMVDPDDLTGTSATMNYGRTHKVNYSTN